MGHAKKKSEWKLLAAIAESPIREIEGAVVDIGMGLSTVVLADLTRKYGREHVTVEKSRKIVSYFGGPYHHLHNIQTMKSVQWIEKHLVPARISFAFLDGDHEFESLKMEFWTIFDRLEPFGAIAVHDCFPPHEKYLRPGSCHDAWKLRTELEKPSMAPLFWVVTFPWKTTAQGCGLTVAIKKDKDQPYWRT